MSDQNNDLPTPASAGEGGAPDAQPAPAEPSAAAPASPDYQAPADTPPSYPAPSTPPPSYAAPAAYPGYSAPPAAPAAYPAYGVPPTAPAYPPAYQGAPAYGVPPTYTPYPAGPKTNSLAIVSLVSAIVGVVLLPFIGSIVGIITGHISLKQIREREEGGRGLALAGTITGYAGLALYAVITVLVVLWIIWVVNLANGAYYDYSYSS
ncbi:DUF4190 domain-containing protein [Microbacterium sp. CIAB417]|uniref:DUF4190 domain-containing protein n=1 Tax=Microbacterium sp. CIAB417 TaxID=2860287 RepID=UPI001FACE3FD|nr:DUF4190 domain-containing protein [Microbacterium sp. CIAB417]